MLVIAERMCAHGECVQARIVGQSDGEGRCLAAVLCLLIDEVSDRPEVGSIFGECGANGGVECTRPVGVQQI